MPPSSRHSSDDKAEAAASRRKRERGGWLAEQVAALYLMGKGYRILKRRFKTRSGEIDLVAKRGKRLAFVEVKQRATLESAEASISDSQSSRIKSAADDWLLRYPVHRNLDIAFDVIFIVKGCWPRHIEHGL
jgi:putative endonuclease